jgi:RNA ligase
MLSNEQSFVVCFNKWPKETIKKLDKYVEEGYIKSNVNKFFPELTIYNYSEHTVFERNWNGYTKACRGLVIDKENLCIVAMPFAKFFNLNELENTELSHLSSLEQKQTYETFLKMDGSLGIGFVHKNTFIWCTRGSFDSEQAQFANYYMREHFTEHQLRNIAFDYERMTILAEIIYPENRIVVDYGNEKSLILLGMIRNDSGIEIPYEDLIIESSSLGLPVVKKYDGDKRISSLKVAAQQWDKNMEGVVIKYEKGKRLKLKGAEYFRVHKIRFGFSTKQKVELWKNGVHTNYLKEIDEEFRDELKSFYTTLDLIFRQYKMEVRRMINDIKVLKLDRSDVHNHFTSRGKEKILISCVFKHLNGQEYDQMIRDYIYREYKSVILIRE